MDSPFVFSQEVVNESFVGRSNERSWLSSNLANTQHTVLMAPPGYGKKSLVRNAFIHATKQTELTLCTCHLFNVRDEYTFYTLLIRELLSTAATTSDEWISLSQELLPLTRPQIDINPRSPHILQLSLDEQRLPEIAPEILQLPQRLATLKNQPFIIWINDFQEITCFDHTAAFQKRAATLWKQQPQVGYLLCGSKLNAMRQLFAPKQPFHGFGEIIPLEPLEERLLVDYIIKLFSKSGRVISREFAEIICRKTGGYPFYVQQLAHLCWLNTKGFVIDTMMDSALNDLLNYNERLFRQITDDLTDFQISYLQALLEGVDRFSAAEVIAYYRLNSSANIVRVRSALEKKEVIHVPRNNKPQFIDPVYERWLRKRYFV